MQQSHKFQELNNKLNAQFEEDVKACEEKYGGDLNNPEFVDCFNELLDARIDALTEAANEVVQAQTELAEAISNELQEAAEALEICLLNAKVTFFDCTAEHVEPTTPPVTWSLPVPPGDVSLPSLSFAGLEGSVVVSYRPGL